MRDRLRLGVNIHHVATVRNARGGLSPDPVRAAQEALAAGADGITAHLREDRRHISDADIEARANVCVLAQDVVRALFQAEDPLGKEIRLAGTPLPETSAITNPMFCSGSSMTS